MDDKGKGSLDLEVLQVLDHAIASRRLAAQSDLLAEVAATAGEIAASLPPDASPEYALLRVLGWVKERSKMIDAEIALRVSALGGGPRH